MRNYQGSMNHPTLTSVPFLSPTNMVEHYEPTEKTEQTLFGMLTTMFLCVLLLTQVNNFSIALIIVLPLVVAATVMMINAVLQDSR